MTLKYQYGWRLPSHRVLGRRNKGWKGEEAPVGGMWAEVMLKAVCAWPRGGRGNLGAQLTAPFATPETAAYKTPATAQRHI